MEKIEMNRVYSMDCIALMQSMPEETVSLILTDPPYGISYQNQFTYRPHKKLKGDDGIDYGTFARESYRILKQNSHAYFFTRFDCYPKHYQALNEAGFQIKNCLVIEKGTVGGIGDLKGSFANNSEWIIFCQKGRREFEKTRLMKNKKKPGIFFHRGGNPSQEYKTRFPCCWFGEGYPKATYSSNWQKQYGIYHPTIKCIECMESLIQISSKPTEVVFDGFMGSGSTALAAIRTGRKYLGAELEPRYFRLIEERIQREMEVR